MVITGGRMMLRGWIGLAVLLSATAATARDVFVDNAAGDDLYDGTLQYSSGGGGPVRSLRKALLVARPGDRVVLANTGLPYRESISLSSARHCGSKRRPFVIEGQGAILDGSIVVPPLAWRHVAGDVFRFRPRRGHYQQLFLDGKPLVRWKAPIGATPASADGLPELAPLEWWPNLGWIYFRVEKGKVPDQYPLQCCGEQVGITLYHVHDVRIVDLVVQGFQLDGVNAHDGVRNGSLGGLTCRGNGRSGVAICGASVVELDGCLLGDNGESQLHIEGLATAALENCELLKDSAPRILFRGGRLFIDAKRWDPAAQ